MIVIPYPGLEWLFFVKQQGENSGDSHKDIPYFFSELILIFMLLRIAYIGEIFHGPDSYLDVYS